jgi:hypothetical protein
VRLRLLAWLSEVWPRREERDWRTLLVYGSAAVLYIGIGVFLTDFLLSVFVAAGYLVLVTWLLPSALRRLR